MGRIRRNIDILEKPHWTLFDSGARNTYIVKDATQGLHVQDLPTTLPSAMGGVVHQVRQSCLLHAEIDHKFVETHARIVDEIGKDEEGKRIEILFGALSMQEWGIHLDLPNERLDLTHYSTTFVEF